METKRENWEVSFEMHLDRFREIEPAEAVLRSGVVFDEERSRFVVELLGHRLYAQWPEFRLTPADEGACPKALYDFQMQVLVLRVLYLGVSVPSTGVFKAYRELPWGEVYDANFNGRCIKRFAFGFGFGTDKFEKAAELLGGVRLSLGDVAFDFSFFGGITCRFILWMPDDEFPPSAQILFSDNSPLIYNAEDLAAVGDVIISALKEMA